MYKGVFGTSNAQISLYVCTVWTGFHRLLIESLTAEELPTGGNQGPVVQSSVSLMSLLVVKMLTVLVSTMTYSHVFLLKQMWVAFANQPIYHRNLCILHMLEYTFALEEA